MLLKKIKMYTFGHGLYMSVFHECSNVYLILFIILISNLSLFVVCFGVGCN